MSAIPGDNNAADNIWAIREQLHGRIVQLENELKETKVVAHNRIVHERIVFGFSFFVYGAVFGMLISVGMDMLFG